MLSQSEALEGDGSTEAQYAYYPATIADATTGTMVTTVQTSDTLMGQTTPTGSQYPHVNPIIYPLYQVDMNRLQLIFVRHCNIATVLDNSI